MKKKSIIQNSIITILCVTIVCILCYKKKDNYQLLNNWKLTQNATEAVEASIPMFREWSEYIAIVMANVDSVILTSPHMKDMNYSPYPNVECGKVSGKTIILATWRYRNIIEMDLDKKIEFYKDSFTKEQYQLIKKGASHYECGFEGVLGYSFKTKKLSKENNYLETEEDSTF